MAHAWLGQWEFRDELVDHYMDVARLMNDTWGPRGWQVAHFDPATRILILQRPALDKPEREADV